MSLYDEKRHGEVSGGDGMGMVMDDQLSKYACSLIFHFLALLGWQLTFASLMVLAWKAVMIWKASSRQGTLQMVYLKPPISMGSSIQAGLVFSSASSPSLVMEAGSLRKTSVTSCPAFSFSLFSVTRSTSQPAPITSRCEAEERLKYAKDAALSSANRSRMEGLPRQNSSRTRRTLIQGYFSKRALRWSSNSVISARRWILRSTLKSSNSTTPFHSGLTRPRSIFFGSILSVTRKAESTMAEATHLKVGQKVSSSVMDSSPSLTGGSRNLSPVLSSGVLNASRPRQMSASERCRGVSMRSKRHSCGMISETERTEQADCCVSTFSALMRFVAKKLARSSNNYSVPSNTDFSLYIYYKHTRIHSQAGLMEGYCTATYHMNR